MVFHSYIFIVKILQKLVTTLTVQERIHERVLIANHRKATLLLSCRTSMKLFPLQPRPDRRNRKWNWSHQRASRLPRLRTPPRHARSRRPPSWRQLMSSSIRTDDRLRSHWRHRRCRWRHKRSKWARSLGCRVQPLPHATRLQCTSTWEAPSTRRRWRHKLTDGTRTRQRRRRNTFTFFTFFLL